MFNEPLAYFLTWTVYGTWLQGDERGWRHYHGGHETPQPLLANWRRERLLHPVYLLTAEHREVVTQSIQKHCEWRNWQLWVVNPRSNHVHAVISARECNGAQVRDQLKANCTRSIRALDRRFVGRPVWSRGGDWKCINNEDELSIVIRYSGEVQDAKHKE